MLRGLFRVLSKVIATHWGLHRLGTLGVGAREGGIAVLLMDDWLSILTELNVKTWPRVLSELVGLASIGIIRYLGPVTFLHHWRLIIAVYSMSSNQTTTSSWVFSSDRLNRLPRILRLLIGLGHLPALLTHRIAKSWRTNALLWTALWQSSTWLTPIHWRGHFLIRIIEQLFTHHFCPESGHLVTGSITAIFLFFLDSHTILRTAHYCCIRVSGASHLMVEVLHRCLKFLHLLLVWFYNRLHLTLRWSPIHRCAHRVLLHGILKTVDYCALFRL